MILFELVAKLQLFPANSTVLIEDSCGCWGDIATVALAPDEDKPEEYHDKSLVILRLAAEQS